MLMKMSKFVLTGMILDYKEKFDSALSTINDEIKQLKVDFCKLESELAISQKVNGKLRQQLALVEQNVGQTNNAIIENALKYHEFVRLLTMMI